MFHHKSSKGKMRSPKRVKAPELSIIAIYYDPTESEMYGRPVFDVVGYDGTLDSGKVWGKDYDPRKRRWRSCETGQTDAQIRNHAKGHIKVDSFEVPGTKKKVQSTFEVEPPKSKGRVQTQRRESDRPKDRVDDGKDRPPVRTLWGTSRISDYSPKSDGTGKCWRRSKRDSATEGRRWPEAGALSPSLSPRGRSARGMSARVPPLHAL